MKNDTNDRNWGHLTQRTLLVYIFSNEGES